MITPREEASFDRAARPSARAHLARAGLSCLVLLALVFLCVTAGASGAASPGKAGYVEDYCAKTNPSYPLEVWWGKPPAWYCTDDLGNPSKSIPFSAASACASAGLGAPDTSKFGVASYVICGTAATPTPPMYTVSGTVSYQGCPSATSCSLGRPPVTVSIWTNKFVTKTKVSGSGAFSLRLKKGLYTIQADPQSYSGWGTKAPGIRALRLTHDVSGVSFVVYELRGAKPCATPNLVRERVSMGQGIGSFNLEAFSLGNGDSSLTGGGGGVSGIKSLTFTKQTDEYSSPLFRDNASGKQFPRVTIEAFKGCDTAPYLIYTLEDVTINQFLTAGSVDHPLDRVTLSFGHIVGKLKAGG